MQQDVTQWLRLPAVEQRLWQDEPKHPARPQILHHTPECLSRLVMQPILLARGSIERLEGRIAKHDGCLPNGAFESVSREYICFR